MSEVNLALLRQRVNDASSPYKVVRRDAIQYVGQMDKSGNVYSLDGTEVLVGDYVSKQLDKIIGLSPQQAKIVRNASGEEGVREFRNYLATAGSMLNPVLIALIADPQKRSISGIVPIEDEPITSDAFFDFLELFLEKNNMYPSHYQIPYDISLGFTIYLNSFNPDVRELVPNEAFLVNSYYLKWNLGEVELGRYFERQICSNGQTVEIKHRDARITSVSANKILGILNYPGNKKYLTESFDKFKEKALEAIKVRASIAELKSVSKKLESYLIDNKIADSIAPFTRELQMYRRAGYNGVSDELRQMMASMTVWDLFNSITDYASNNTDWDANDNRRGLLQGDAFKFLMRERDIKNYTDIFS